MSRQNDTKEDCPPSGGHQLRGRETLGESCLLRWQNPDWNGVAVDKVKGFRGFCVGIVIYVDFEIISIYLGVLERKINEIRVQMLGTEEI